MNRKLRSVLSLLKTDWQAILALAVYDFWLLAFPLQGYFLLKVKNYNFFPYFIVPHTLSLFFIAWIGYKINFPKLSFTAGILTSFLTAFFLFVPQDSQNYLFILLGASSSFLITRIGCALRATKDPLLSSALGLAFGNVLLAVFLYLNLPEKYLFPILGTLLLIQIFLRLYPSQLEPIKPLLKYLPFIFSFYLLIGMFYVGLMPFYLQHFYLQGIELLFYIIAIFVSVYFFKKRSDLSLAIGIGAGIFAVTFLHCLNFFCINLSMYFVQMAAGFMDVFCFGMFLQGKDVIRRFSLGAGSMLLGPTVGFPVLFFKKWPFLMVIAGNLILGIALVVFYFVVSLKKTISSQKEVESQFNKNKNMDRIFKNLGISKDIFSQREIEVFFLVISGKNIKEIARTLHISESSVKTYLQRIYRKLNVSSKAELLSKVSSLKNRKIVKFKIVKK